MRKKSQYFFRKRGGGGGGSGAVRKFSGNSSVFVCTGFPKCWVTYLVSLLWAPGALTRVFNVKQPEALTAETRTLMPIHNCLHFWSFSDCLPTRTLDTQLNTGNIITCLCHIANCRPGSSRAMTAKKSDNSPKRFRMHPKLLPNCQICAQLYSLKPVVKKG